jgi:fatty-acid desaturase
MSTRLKLWLFVFGLAISYVGLIFWSPTSLLWSFIPTFILAVPTTTVYDHRCKNHRAFKMPVWMQNFYETAQYTTIGSKTEEWVLVHRPHHAHSDAVGDPHSPRIHLVDGQYVMAQSITDELIPVILPFNVLKYKRFIKENGHLIPIIARDVLEAETRWTKFLNRHKWAGLPVGIILLCTATFLAGQGVVTGLIAAYLHFVTFVFILNPLINGLCHWPHKWLGGYQHNKKDAHANKTWNNWVIAFLTGGEGFHHNHHWEQRSIWLGKYWYEKPADWGCWLYILPFKAIGVITDCRYHKEFTV